MTVEEVTTQIGQSTRAGQYYIAWACTDPVWLWSVFVKLFLSVGILYICIKMWFKGLYTVQHAFSFVKTLQKYVCILVEWICLKKNCKIIRFIISFIDCTLLHPLSVLYSIHWVYSIPSIECSLFHPLSVLYSIHSVYSIASIECTLYHPLSVFYCIHWVWSIASVECTYSIHWVYYLALMSVLYSIHWLYSIASIECTLYHQLSVVYIIHCVYSIASIECNL